MQQLRHGVRAMSRTLGLLLAPVSVAAIGAVALVLGPSAPFGTNDGGSGDGGDGGTTSDGGSLDGTTTCVPSTISAVCAPDGGPGCAGSGGGGGTGGQGGGAAIALFVSGNSDVTMTHGALFTGFGGTGGQGGAGGIGSSGAPGNNGASVSCHQTCDMTCQPSGGFVLDGGVGGTAGNGGPGGTGGGGAGGPTYLYATQGAAVVTLSADALAASKFKGAPGPGGLPNGPDGGQGDHP